MTAMPNIKPGLEALMRALGAEAVITDSETCAIHSQDVYREAEPVDAVVQPQDKDALKKAVGIATQHGLAIFPRGGGYSYSDAYLPSRRGSISLDTSKVNRIIEINAEDGYVTVEAGCTWKVLDDALAKEGVRGEFWGPLSGHFATIGGSISQGSLSLGTGKHGVSSEAVLGMEIIKADGTSFHTGSDGQAGKSPFFRNYGPDLTGPFCGDAGALGIKATVTLRLRQRAKLTQGLSFGFADFDSAVKGMNAIAKTGRVTESFGFTRYAMEAALVSPGLWHDLKLMYAVGRASNGFFGGLGQMVRMALAGRRFAKQAQFVAHVVVEADNTQELKGALKIVHGAVKGLGKDLPNTMPTVMRAEPFMPYAVVSPLGQRQLPLHGILQFSKTVAFHDGMTALHEKYADDIAKYEIIIPAMFSTVSTHGFLYEPVLYWPDNANDFHKKYSPQEMIDGMRPEPNVEARKVVEALRWEIVDLIHSHGGVPLQIGKAYPYLRDRTDEQITLLKSIKAQMDPDGLINPGALGLG
ncbi:MAG: FAD-binding oxidoreductase [Sphingomonadales bacterium]